MANQYTKARGEQTEQAEPGTRAAVDEVAAATGHGGLPDRYTNEGIDEYNIGKEQAAAYVIRSDHEADCQARAAIRRMGGAAPSPTDEIAQPYIDANPDRAFRWLTRQHCEKRGKRGWQTVYDANGKKVTHLNEDRVLAHKPKDVRDEQLAEYRRRDVHQRQAARESAVEAGRRAEMDSQGAIKVVSGDQMTRLVEGRRR